MRISGGCHCKNISFVLDWNPAPAVIAARTCDCTFCSKHGGVWTSTPAGRLEVTVRNVAGASRYAFGTRTAEFHVCSGCGVVPVVTSRIGGRLYAVVSVNAFEGVPSSLLEVAGASFQQESEEVRLARRTRNWIPDVKWIEGGTHPSGS